MDEKIELIVSGVVAKITFNISLSFSMKVSHVAVISSLVIERLVASLTFIFLQCPLTFWNITLSSSNVICEMFDQPITEGTRLWLELYIMNFLDVAVYILFLPSCILAMGTRYLLAMIFTMISFPVNF